MNRDRRDRRPVIIVLAFVLLATACGQYPEVHERAVGLVGGTGPGSEPGAVTGPGITGPGATVPGATGPGATVPGATGPGTGPGAGTGTGRGGSAPPGRQGGAPPPTGGDSTGVTSSTITIGIHAPLTGAAPLKASSFEKGREIYWEKGNNGGPVTIFGRRVKVVFHDDQYNPSHARLVCKEMAEDQKAFLLIGGGGTDQIQACAQYAASRGIPYLSAGTTEVGMKNLRNYFGISMSYAQQSTLLAQFIKKRFNNPPAARIAMVATDTANFDDAVDAFERAYPGAKIFRPSKSERGSSRAGSLCTASAKNFDIVYPLTAPAYYLEMAGAAKCKPQYVGVGITMGLDQVADLGCKSDESTKNALFFHPAPAFANSDSYDAQFRKQGGSDDIIWLLWGLSKTLHQLLLKAGQNLTREGFIHTTERASVRTGVFPDLQFSQQAHFGARQVHVLKNVCSGSGGSYVTDAAFKSSF